MANKININQNQLYSTAGALDPRFIVDSVDKITSISNAYVGLEVSVIDSEGNTIEKYRIKKINNLTKKPLPANQGGYELIQEPKDLKYSDGVTSFLNNNGNIDADYLKFADIDGSEEEKSTEDDFNVKTDTLRIDGTTYENSKKLSIRNTIGALENITSMQNVQPVIEALNNRTAKIDQQTNEVRALGYKVLNPNLSFAEQVNSANTIYEVKDSFDLNNGNVTIPDGSTLKFNGGSLRNGTLNFNGCYIDSSNVQIFGTDMEFANVNVKNTELVATWFGFTPENTDVTQLNKIIAFGCNVFVPKGEYLLTSSIVKTTNNLGRIRGEMRNTFLKSTTCDIFNVRKLEISDFTIRAEGYYGIKDNNGYLKVVNNDIRRCAVGVGSELGTPINKMETEITQNTIQYCTDCGIKYHGSVAGSAATDGYISGLVIHDNYIVKAGTNVDDYTTPGTEGKGYGMFIKDVYSAVITENATEYCSCGGILFQIKDYVSTNVSIKYNRFEQNKRFQICVDVTTGSNVRGVEITNNSSSYPFAKVSNFIKEWYLTGRGVLSGIVNRLHKNNIFGFSRSNPLGINDLYTYCQSLYSVGITNYVENVVIKDIQDNASIDLYKLYRIGSYPICAVEKGKTYVIQFDIEKKVSVSGYYFLKITGDSENINVSYPLIQQNTVFHCKCFVVPTATDFLSFSGSYFTGNVDNIDSDTVMFKITNLTVLESNSVIANSLTEIRGISSSATGCRVFINGASNSMNIYNGTSWVEQDGEAAGIRRTGTSSQRPTPINIGFKYFDTSLGKPIYWNGSAWTDANGETVGLQVSDTSVLIGAAAGSATINVYHANALNVSALNPDNTPATWLTVPSTVAVGTNTLTISAAANKASNPRGAKVIIEDSTDVVIVNVVQNYSTN